MSAVDATALIAVGCAHLFDVPRARDRHDDNSVYGYRRSNNDGSDLMGAPSRK